MNLEELNKRADRKGFIFLYTAIIAFIAFIVLGTILFGGEFLRLQEALISAFLSTMVISFLLFSQLRKNWPFGNKEEITVLCEDINELAEIIKGSPCKISTIESYREIWIKKKNLHFSFKNKLIYLKGIRSKHVQNLDNGTMFSMVPIPSVDGKIINIQIEKIV